MYFQYEIVNYGYKNGLFLFRILAPIYGIIIIALGALVMGLELPSNDATANTKWGLMSEN